MNIDWTKYLSRKFLLAVALCAVATGLALHLDGTTLTEWGTVVGILAGGYIAGNVSERFAIRSKE